MSYETHIVLFDVLFNIILGISFLIISIGLLSAITTLRMHSEDKRKIAVLLSAVIIFLGLILYVKAFFVDYPSKPKVTTRKITSEKEIIKEEKK